MAISKPGVSRISLLGCPIDVCTVGQTLDLVDGVISARATCRHGFVNAGKIVSIQTNGALREALSSCDLINADGMGVVWASRVLGVPLPERVNGTNLMMALFSQSHKKGYRIYLLGARPEVIERTVQALTATYPGIQISGWHHGYFRPADEPQIVEEIRQSKADILFVGMGTPQKEYWLQRNVPQLDVPFCMGVGGSFDVLAGVVKRAPVWAQEMGLEWLWRLIQEPRRMWRRYLLGNVQFVWLVGRERARRLIETSRVRRRLR